MEQGSSLAAPSAAGPGQRSSTVSEPRNSVTSDQQRNSVTSDRRSSSKDPERKGPKLSLKGVASVARTSVRLSLGSKDSSASRGSRGSVDGDHHSLKGPPRQTVRQPPQRSGTIKVGGAARRGSKNSQDEENTVGTWTWISRRFANGHEDLIYSEIERGKVDPNAHDGDLGHSISMCAIWYGDLRMLKLLIQKRADLNYEDADGFSAFHMACKTGRLNVVEYLAEVMRKDNKENFKKQVQHQASHRGNKWTPLHWAAVNGSYNMAVLLLDHKAILDHPDATGKTPLMWACLHGYEDVVRLFVERGANLEGAGDCAIGFQEIRSRILLVERLNNALLDAACRQDLQGFHEAIQNGAQINARDEQGWTALMWFAVEGDYDIVKLLLNQKADLNIIGVDGRSALALARDKQYYDVVNLLERTIVGTKGMLAGAKRGDLEMTQCGVEFGGRIEPAKFEDSIAWGPAQWAAARGDVSLLKYLVESKSNLERRDPDGRTCALIAAGCGSISALKFLSKSKADLEARSSAKEGILLLAAKGNHDEAVAWSMEHFRKAGKHSKWKDMWKGHPDVEKDAEKAVHFAARRGFSGVLHALNDAEANLDTKNKEGLHALMPAVRGNHLDAAILLAGRGKVATETTGSKGETPLFVAAQAGRARLCEILLERKAEVNAKDKNGETPLHVASRKNLEDIVHILVFYGADSKLKNEKKKAPVDVCPQQVPPPKNAWDTDTYLSNVAEKLARHRAIQKFSDKDEATHGRLLNFRRMCGDNKSDQEDNGSPDSPRSLAGSSSCASPRSTGGSKRARTGSSPSAKKKTASGKAGSKAKAKAASSTRPASGGSTRSAGSGSSSRPASSPALKQTSIQQVQSYYDPVPPDLDSFPINPASAIMQCPQILVRPRSAPSLCGLTSLNVSPTRTGGAERILRVAGRQKSAQIWMEALKEAERPETEAKKKKTVSTATSTSTAASHTKSEAYKHSNTTPESESKKKSVDTSSATPKSRRTEPPKKDDDDGIQSRGSDKVPPIVLTRKATEEETVANSTEPGGSSRSKLGTSSKTLSITTPRKNEEPSSPKLKSKDLSSPRNRKTQNPQGSKTGLLQEPASPRSPRPDSSTTPSRSGRITVAPGAGSRNTEPASPRCSPRGNAKPRRTSPGGG